MIRGASYKEDLTLEYSKTLLLVRFYYTFLAKTG